MSLRKHDTPRMLLTKVRTGDYAHPVTVNKQKKQLYSQSKSTWSHEAINLGFKDFLRKYNFIPQLKKITASTLILAGKDDWICSLNQSKIIAKNIPKSELKIFNHCGHALAVDAHDKYIKVIKQFLSK